MLDGSAKDRIKQLCDLIAKEQDPKRFSVLITELNQLLEGRVMSSPRDARSNKTTSAEKSSS